jgi:hypothetical protein
MPLRSMDVLLLLALLLLASPSEAGLRKNKAIKAIDAPRQDQRKLHTAVTAVPEVVNRRRMQEYSPTCKSFTAVPAPVRGSCTIKGRVDYIFCRWSLGAPWFRSTPYSYVDFIFKSSSSCCIEIYDTHVSCCLSIGALRNASTTQLSSCRTCSLIRGGIS